MGMEAKNGVVPQMQAVVSALETEIDEAIHHAILYHLDRDSDEEAFHNYTGDLASHPHHDLEEVKQLASMLSTKSEYYEEMLFSSGPSRGRPPRAAGSGLLPARDPRDLYEDVQVAEDLAAKVAGGHDYENVWSLFRNTPPVPAAAPCRPCGPLGHRDGLMLFPSSSSWRVFPAGVLKDRGRIPEVGTLTAAHALGPAGQQAVPRVDCDGMAKDPVPVPADQSFDQGSGTGPSKACSVPVPSFLISLSVLVIIVVAASFIVYQTLSTKHSQGGKRWREKGPEAEEATALEVDNNLDDMFRQQWSEWSEWSPACPSSSGPCTSQGLTQTRKRLCLVGTGPAEPSVNCHGMQRIQEANGTAAESSTEFKACPCNPERPDQVPRQPLWSAGSDLLLEEFEAPSTSKESLRIQTTTEFRHSYFGAGSRRGQVRYHVAHQDQQDYPATTTEPGQTIEKMYYKYKVS